MRTLSSVGQQAIRDLAQRHGFSQDAVLNLLDALLVGQGSMAQFNHPEFGGSGQWMRGGLIMLSDLFNHTLKARIDSLCNDLAGLIASQPGAVATGGFQTQSQSSGGLGLQQQSNYGSGQTDSVAGAASLFIPPVSASFADWWGADLGLPASAGSQNGARYAYFPQARRLAIDFGGRVTLYDTLDHQIGGFSQQQSSGGSLTFTSQHGLVEISRLPIVSGEAAPAPAPVRPGVSETQPVQTNGLPTPSSSESGGAIFNHIERLAELHAKGILSDQEFAEKKKELLSRL